MRMQEGGFNALADGLGTCDWGVMVITWPGSTTAALRCLRQHFAQNPATWWTVHRLTPDLDWQPVHPAGARLRRGRSIAESISGYFVRVSNNALGITTESP
jgi:hypothetical protein